MQKIVLRYGLERAGSSRVKKMIFVCVRNIYTCKWNISYHLNNVFKWIFKKQTDEDCTKCSGFQRSRMSLFTQNEIGTWRGWEKDTLVISKISRAEERRCWFRKKGVNSVSYVLSSSLRWYLFIWEEMSTLHSVDVELDPQEK